MYADLEHIAHHQLTERLRAAAEPHLTPRRPLRRRTAHELRRLANRLDASVE